MIIPILVFVLGLLIGSFLNALIHRIRTGESVFHGRSYCPHCRRELAWQDLIPMVSFFISRGRCRYCNKKISIQYPLVELATGSAFLIANIQYPVSSINFWFLAAFSAILIIIFVYDFKHYLILDKVVLPAGALALAYQIWQGRVLDAIYGALFLAGFFLLLYLVSRGRWLGFGDVKLGVFLGILVPWPETLSVFFLAYFIGAAVALVLVALGRKQMSGKLPFGTFLSFAGFIGMIWGREIMEWYLSLVGLQ